MKQLALAVVNYHDTHEHYPPAYVTDAAGRPWHSWRIALLPYLEQDALFRAYDFSEPWDGPKNRTLAGRMPKGYAFHGTYHSGSTTTNYLAVVGPQTVWPGQTTLSSRDVKDGLSSTVLVVENRGMHVPWMEPRDLQFDEMSFEIDSPAGLSSPYADPAVAMLDGSLYRLRKDVSPSTLRALLTANGGEEVQQGEQGWVVLPDGRQREVVKP